MRLTGVLSLAAMVLISAPAWSQTTTGRLMGNTVDESGAALQGVSVTVSSPALIGGAQMKTTDDQGEFVFLSLAPGNYTMHAAKHGLISQQRTPVKVPLGGAVVVNLVMPPGTFSGDVEVIDEVPVIDTTQVNTGQIFQVDYMQNSAIGSNNRSYTTVVNQTAGVVGGTSWAGVQQPGIFGSTFGENAFFIDGMDATNPVMGVATAVLNFDAIGEIQLQTGGFEAEYGRATGGIINLVSKSGGNHLSGTFDARYSDQSFRESGDQYDASVLSTKRQIFGATLGGPILHDTVWFFASLERINDLKTPVASPTTREKNGQNYLGKITWQIAPAWRLSGKYTSDPTTWDNINASRWVMPDATGQKKGITSIFAAELTSVLSDVVLWNTTLGTYDYQSKIDPLHGDRSAISHFNFDTNIWTANYDQQLDWETSRKDFTTDLTWFVDELAGSHEFKGGIEYSDLYTKSANCNTGTPNGEHCVPDGVGFIFGDIGVSASLPLYMGEFHTSGPSKYDGTVSTVFAQDAWRPERNLTLKIGLRYDSVTYDTNNGVQIADISMLQPRLGFAWDIAGDAKNILRGSWGRFMHPNMLSLAYHVRDLVEPSSTWYSCSTIMEAASIQECQAIAGYLGWGYRADNAGWDPNGWVLAPWEVYASEPNRSDPNIRATYADELILAYEREVGARSAIELTFIDKKVRDVVDDTCNGNWPTPSADAACDYFFFANFDELNRDYRAATLTFETRSYSWLTLLASYTLSSTKGSTGYNQNSSVALDVYPWHFDNIYGYLDEHRKHRVRLNGFFNLKGDWNIAFDARWSSPFTWTPQEDSLDNPDIPLATFHLVEPRGSREANSNHQIDLQLSKGFTAGRVRFVLIGTVLNAFSSEEPTDVCQETSGCGFYEDAIPIDMGDPTNWQTPRRYELGFRLEF